MNVYILTGVIEYEYCESIGVYESREDALQAYECYVTRIQEDDPGLSAFDYYQIETATLGAPAGTLAVEVI